MTTALSGTIGAIRWSNDRFTIGTLIPESGPTATFTCPAHLVRDQAVTLHGEWRTHPRYGRQFVATTMTVELPIDATGLAHFLSVHPAARGIGPVKAKRIADAYGADFGDVLQDDPASIADRYGLKLSDVEALRDAWAISASANAVSTQLAAYGLTYHQITTVVRALGPNAATLLRDDPYRLVGTSDGLGFTRVDQVAQRLGIHKRHPGRLRAGLCFLLKEAMRDGHCWVDREELVHTGINRLALDELDVADLLRTQLQALETCDQVVSTEIDDRPVYALPTIAEWERGIAQWLTSANRPLQRSLPSTDILSHLPDGLNEEQILAVLQAFQSRASVITGGAGVGKTFTVANIVRIAHQRGHSVHLAAPTGKAARRMAEQVAAQGGSVTASTIHRLLDYHPVEGWRVNADNPLEVDLLIIDETSMLDAELAHRLADGVCTDRTRVVFVGDPNQLPPVGAGAFLRDLIATSALPTTALRTVMRQAGVLREHSLAILTGVFPASQRDGESVPPERRTSWRALSQFTDPSAVPIALDHLWSQVIPERFGLTGPRRPAETQILTPTHKGPLGTIAINRVIQERTHGTEAMQAARQDPVFAKRDPMVAGDKVVWTRNDYSLGLFNGQIGFVDRLIRASSQTGKGSTQPALVITFDDQTVTVPRDKWTNLRLAYAMTIHKAQGSEWPCVIVICHKQHSFQHHRHALYTAATRASRCCIVLGDGWSMRRAAKTIQADNRRTFLTHWLNDVDHAIAQRVAS